MHMSYIIAIILSYIVEKHSSERDCALVILFQIYGSKAGLFEGNLLWVDQHDLLTFILEVKNQSNINTT